MKKLSPLQVAQKWSQASGDKVSLRWAKGQEARKAARPGKSISMTRIDRNPVGVTRTKIDRFAKGDGMSVSAFGVEHTNDFGAVSKVGLPAALRPRSLKPISAAGPSGPKPLKPKPPVNGGKPLTRESATSGMSGIERAQTFKAAGTEKRRAMGYRLP